MTENTGFTYFMLRVARPTTAGPHRVSGTVERLGTGEKCSFADGAELLDLLETWPGTSLKMWADPGLGNVMPPEVDP